MREFDIIKAAKRTKPNRGFTDGYIVKYDGELYFIHTPDEGISLNECVFWTHDIEKHWCIDEYDPNFYQYYEIEGILRPLVLEGDL